MSNVEGERVRSVNKWLDPVAFEIAWSAYQNTLIDLVADSDDETCKCVHNAIAAYLVAVGQSSTNAVMTDDGV